MITVLGSNLDSVAEPEMTLTVDITRMVNDTFSSFSRNEADSGVTEHAYT